MVTFTIHKYIVGLQYTDKFLDYDTQRYLVYYTLIFSLGNNAWFTIHKYVLVNVTLVHFRTQKIMKHIWSLSLHNFFFVSIQFLFLFFSFLYGLLHCCGSCSCCALIPFYTNILIHIQSTNKTKTFVLYIQYIYSADKLFTTHRIKQFI